MGYSCIVFKIKLLQEMLVMWPCAAMQTMIFFRGNADYDFNGCKTNKKRTSVCGVAINMKFKLLCCKLAMWSQCHHNHQILELCNFVNLVFMGMVVGFSFGFDFLTLSETPSSFFPHFQLHSMVASYMKFVQKMT